MCIQATATLATLVGWVGGYPEDHLDLPISAYHPGLPDWEDRLGPDLVDRLVDRLGLLDFPVRLGFAGSAAGPGSAAGLPENFTADHLVDSGVGHPADLAVATLLGSAVGASVDLAARTLVSTPATDRDEGAVMRGPMPELGGRVMIAS